jgi:ribosomal protein L32
MTPEEKLIHETRLAAFEDARAYCLAICEIRELHEDAARAINYSIDEITRQEKRRVMSPEEKAERRRKAMEFFASLPEIPPCEFCGRLVLAGRCCSRR